MVWIYRRRLCQQIHRYFGQVLVKKKTHTIKWKTSHKKSMNKQHLNFF